MQALGEVPCKSISDKPLDVSFTRLLTDTCPQQCEPAIVRAFCAPSDKPRLKICILLSARVLPQSIAKSVAL